MATHTTDILIKASAETVFAALTQPELIQKWQFGRAVTTDWKVGSPIQFVSETETKPLKQWGTILQFQTNERIQYNLFTPQLNLEDKPEYYAVTTYVLHSVNDHTRVELIQEDNRPTGFVGITLKPILVALKNSIETQSA